MKPSVGVGRSKKPTLAAERHGEYITCQIGALPHTERWLTWVR